MSLCQKYLEIFAMLAPVGASLVLGPAATVAREESTQQRAAVAERLAAIRQAVSAVEGQTNTTTPPYRLAWGNTNPITGKSYPPGMRWPNVGTTGYGANPPGGWTRPWPIMPPAAPRNPQNNQGSQLDPTNNWNNWHNW
jgi:hypothetical protein